MLYQKEASLIDTLVFTLSDFEGPLDLLLYLVSKNKMQIADVEIVSLIDQYLAVVNGPAGAELDQTSEFIEMAARLIYMKSVFLLPRSPEADQLRQELTGQLVEYSACKQAAAMLGQMADGIFLAVRQPAVLEQEHTYSGRHSAWELIRALQTVQGRAQNRPAAPRQESFDPIVAAPFVSVASRVVHILRGLVTGKTKKLGGLFRRGANRSETVATFLAVLELLKAGRIKVYQDQTLALCRRSTEQQESADGTGTI